MTVTESGIPASEQQGWQACTRTAFTAAFHWLGFFILIAIVVSACAIAVVMFSAAQLQSRVSELTINGTPLTIWRVDHFRGDLAQWNISISRRRQDVEVAKAKTALNDRDTASMEVDIQAHEKRLLADLDRIRPRLKPGTVNAFTSSQSLAIVFSQFEIDVDSLSPERSSQLEGEINRTKESYSRLDSAHEKLDAQKSEGFGFRAELKQAETNLTATLGEVARLFGTTSSDMAPEFIERVVNITAELEASTKVWDQLVYQVALWPNDMLILLLVISMGVLGSGLHLLSAMGPRNTASLPLREYVFRLAFGAVTAIVLFIVFKSGIPIITDTTKVGGTAPINPYFISVLGIISGLMSERVLGRIRSVGTTLLRSEGEIDDHDRYARSVIASEMEKPERSYDVLARLIRKTVDETKELMDGRNPVSPNAQSVISAYLGQPVRDLFLDIKAE
jgi:hypothetical protein